MNDPARITTAEQLLFELSAMFKPRLQAEQARAKLRAMKQGKRHIDAYTEEYRRYELKVPPAERSFAVFHEYYR